MNICICVCGGDGSVGWILSHLIDSFPSLSCPPICILPLGTGNDLSRVLGWGKNYSSKRLQRTLNQISYAQVMMLDRWMVTFESSNTMPTTNNHEDLINPRCPCFLIDHSKFVRSTNHLKYSKHLKPLNQYFFSHMSFGLDAAIALDFHIRRIRDSSQFTSSFKNKFLYLYESRKYFKEFFFSNTWNLSLYIKLICDGQDLTHSIQSCHTLVLKNSSGYASGTNPSNNIWTNRCDAVSSAQSNNNSHNQIRTKSNLVNDTSKNTCIFMRQNYGDQKIEVLGLSAKQMGLIHLGFKGNRIAQCNQVHTELNCPMAVQMDGEPFYLAKPFIVNISHSGQASVLRSRHT